MPRVIFHIDMDAFYASVEQRDNPAYRGRPLIVGSPPDQRGVVCAASYEARKFGVKSAMPSRTAGKLCPKGIFVRPRMEAYRAESAIIMGILRTYTDKIERVSVDEAYLDLSDHFQDLHSGGREAPHAAQADSHLPPPALTPASAQAPPPPISADSAEAKHEDAAASSQPSPEPAYPNDPALLAAATMAREIKERILSERQLTSSIGIGSNKFLAKLGSEHNKPNGLCTILDRDKVAFLRPLSIRSIHGVGPVTATALEEVGVLTIGDLQATTMNLERVVGSFASSLKSRAMGEDTREVDTSEERKSISAENTFLNDTDHRPTLRAALKELAADVAETLAKHHLGALTVQVKVRYSDFTTLTRQLRVQEPVTGAAEVYHLACFLLARHQLVTGPLRLIGIGVSTLVAPETEQLRLGIE